MATPMSTCDRCGSAVRPNASFCPNCGAPLGNVNASTGGAADETLVPGGVRPEPAPEAGFFGGMPGSAVDEPRSDAGGWGDAGGWQAEQSPLPPVEPAVPERSPFDLPPSSGPDVFTPTVAAGAGAVGGLRRRLPLVIGCCAGAALLACVIIFGLGSWLMNASGGF